MHILNLLHWCLLEWEVGSRDWLSLVVNGIWQFVTFDRMENVPCVKRNDRMENVFGVIFFSIIRSSHQAFLNFKNKMVPWSSLLVLFGLEFHLSLLWDSISGSVKISVSMLLYFDICCWTFKRTFKNLLCYYFLGQSFETFLLFGFSEIFPPFYFDARKQALSSLFLWFMQLFYLVVLVSLVAQISHVN